MREHLAKALETNASDAQQICRFAKAFESRSQLDNLFGALEFSEAMACAGIQPIVGCTLALTFEARREPTPELVSTIQIPDDILAAARGQAERMVQRSEVNKAAEARARRIVEQARAEASRLRNECDDFCDKRLAQFETVLERTMGVVAAGRVKLRGPLAEDDPVEDDADPDPDGRTGLGIGPGPGRNGRASAAKADDETGVFDFDRDSDGE